MRDNAMRAEPLATPPVQRASSLAEIQERVGRLDPSLDPCSPTFRAAVLLLASLQAGQNVDRLTRFTRYPQAFVAQCARRLVDNGVWKNGSTVSEWYRDGDDRRAFWNDVHVAEGKLCRRVNQEGEIEWAPPGVWLKNYDYVEPRPHTEVTVLYFTRNEEETPEPFPAQHSAGDEPDDDEADEAGEDGYSAAGDPASEGESSRIRHPVRWRAAHRPVPPGAVRRKRLRAPYTAPLSAPEPPRFPDLFPGATWLG